MHPSDDTRELRATALEDIARLIARHVPGAGDHLTQISALSLHRRHAPTDPVPCIYPLGLVLIAQGAKQVLVGESGVELHAGAVDGRVSGSADHFTRHSRNDARAVPGSPSETRCREDR